MNKVDELEENYGKDFGERENCSTCGKDYEEDTSEVLRDSVDIEAFSTIQDGSFAVLNRSPYLKIKEVFVSHKSNALTFPTRETLYNIESFTMSKQVKFSYSPGTTSPSYDYWYVEALFEDTEKGTSFRVKTKDNFYCSVASSDNGAVLLSVNSNRMHVYFSNSSRCSVPLYG